MKSNHQTSPNGWVAGFILALLLGGAIQAASGAEPTAPAINLPGTRAPKPAVWVFGPVEGNVQPFRVTITGFGATTLPEGLVLSVPGQAAPRVAGTPDLPVVSVLIRGLEGKTARAEVAPPQWIVVPGVRVAPAESPALDETTGEASETVLVRTPAAVYGADAFWPAELVKVEEAWIGTEKKLRLECVLVQHNPVGQLLRYTLVLEGRLVFESTEKPGSP